MVRSLFVRLSRLFIFCSFATLGVPDALSAQGSHDALVEIRQLRIDGKYPDALILSRQYRDSLDDNSPTFRHEDADRLVATLEHILSLTDRNQRELARVHALDEGIDRLMYQWRFIEALARTTDQLAVRSHHLGAQHHETADTHHRVAIILQLSGGQYRPTEQARYALELRQAALGPAHPKVAQSLVRVARNSRSLITREEGLEMLGEAQQIVDATVGSDHLIAAELMHARGVYLRHQIPNDEVVVLYENAIDVRARHLGDYHPETLSTRCWLAHFVEASGDGDRAVQLAHEVIKGAGLCDVPQLGILSPTYSVLGSSAAREGHAEEALEYFDELMRLRNDARRRVPLWLGLARSAGGSDVNQAYILLHQDRGDEAWESIQEGRGWITTGIMMPRAFARDLGETELHDSLRNALNDAERRLDAVDDGGSAHAERLQMLIALSALVSLERDLIDRTKLSFPQSRLAALQQSLNANTAMVGWLFYAKSRRFLDNVGWRPDGQFELWGYVVRDSGPVQWVPLMSTTQRAEWKAFSDCRGAPVEGINRAAEWPRRVTRDKVLDDAIAALSRKMFFPLEKYLDGVEEIIVTTDFLRAGLPIECLVTSDDRDLIERYAVFYVPSVDFHISNAESHSELSTRPVLAVGDPVYDLSDGEVQPNPTDYLAMPSSSVLDATVVRSVLDDNNFVSLPRLPMSRGEASTISSMFRESTLLLGAQASETKLEELARDHQLQEFGSLHFATHALIHQREPERSALILSRSTDRNPDVLDDQRVLAREIQLGWTLDAEMVTFSACQTGRGVGSIADGPLGFHQALLAAGARSLVTSSWKVDDAATAFLMVRFYENLTGSYKDERNDATGTPMRKVDALREAKMWLRDFEDDNGKHPFEHPAYWAGFVLIGDAN